jgi:GT2 family glycosyltransferase
MIYHLAEDDVAVIIIGRNEGQRLVTCITSVLGFTKSIVYVDSGSTDDSIKNAKSYNIDIVKLNLVTPYTAARARNAGAVYLLNKKPNIKYLQFVDGDCEIQKGWLVSAKTFLDKNPDYAVICGRRRERHPEHSIYNTLCDIEWNSPIGDTTSCGGDALIRASSFSQINGFNSSLIAGEEPEMCFRLRQKGCRIYRINEEMTLHDANMTHFSQWWNRAKRAGYAYALSVDLHGKSGERFKVKELRSIIAWGAFLPTLIFCLSFFHINAISLISLYLVQIARLFLKLRKLTIPTRVKFYYALLTMVAKFPQFMGITQFMINKKYGNTASLIEYK